VLRAAAGELGDDAVVAAGREIRLGDFVVTRRNDRRLRGPDGTWFVKNGSRGTVVGVDVAAGEVVVDFEARAGALHRVQLPAAYLDAGHVEWAYALTDYGVQGRTLCRSLAVLEEASTAPGTYVATTRGRTENRLYIADGDLIDGDGLDTSHGIPRVRTPPIQELTARVAARRPDGMLHDRDPDVRAATRLAEGTDLSTLQAMLRDLDTALAAIPSDQTGALQSALAARRLIAGARDAGADNLTADDLTRRLARLDASIHRLELRQNERNDAVNRRDSQLAQRALLTDAIALRLTKDRLASASSRDTELPGDTRAADPARRQ
jgi:hypothetical protein